MPTNDSDDTVVDPIRMYDMLARSQGVSEQGIRDFHNAFMDDDGDEDLDMIG